MAEPSPLQPEQVPAEWVELGIKASDDYTYKARQWTDGGHVRMILAAAAPRIKATAMRELAAEAELKPGPYWVHVAGWLRRRAAEIEQEATDA